MGFEVGSEGGKIMNLYELKEDYLKVLELIESGEDGLDDTLESISDTIDVKADGYVRIVRNLEGNVNTLKTEIERLSSRKKHMENNIDRLRESLKNAMIETGKEKIKTELFNIRVGKETESIEVIDQSLLPKDCVRTKVEPDKIAIKDALKNGQAIQGIKIIKKRGIVIS